MMEKHWARNQKIWVLDLALGPYYLYDPKELSIFIHSFIQIYCVPTE